MSQEPAPAAPAAQEPVAPVTPAAAPEGAAPAPSSPPEPNGDQVANPPGEGGQEATTTSDDGTNQGERQDGDEPPLRGIQKRINELTHKNRDLSQQNQALLQQQQQSYQQQQQTQLDQRLSAPMPQLAEFNYDEPQYQQAVQSWAQQRDEAIQELQAQERQQTQAQERQQQQRAKYQQKMSQAVEKHPDFIATVGNPDLPSLAELSPVGFQAVLDSDSFPDVAMHVAQNPDILWGFSEMTPVQAIKEVARIEMLVSKPAPSAPVVQAPPPPTTVDGVAPAAVLDDDLPIDEWMAKRKKQIANQR